MSPDEAKADRDALRLALVNVLACLHKAPRGHWSVRFDAGFDEVFAQAEALATAQAVKVAAGGAPALPRPEELTMEEIGRRICHRSAVYPTQDGDLVVEFGGMRSRLALHFEPDGKVSAVTVGMRDGHIVSEHHEHPADIGAKLHGQPSRAAAAPSLPEETSDRDNLIHVRMHRDAAIARAALSPAPGGSSGEAGK